MRPRTRLNNIIKVERGLTQYIDHLCDDMDQSVVYDIDDICKAGDDIYDMTLDSERAEKVQDVLAAYMGFDTFEHMLVRKN
jgi:hypothetical protein